MEDLTKRVAELFKPTEPQKEAELKNTTETPNLHFAGVDLAAIAAGRAGLAQWPQSFLPTGGGA